MREWADFHPRIMPFVPGCPSPMVDIALIDSARAFCERTKCWKQDEVNIANGIDSVYYLDVPIGAELVQIISAQVDDGDPLPIKHVSGRPADWSANPPSENVLYHGVERDEFMVFPAPSAGSNVRLTVAYMPSEAGTGVDDKTFALYVEAISAGARAYLQRMPRREWTDVNQAFLDAKTFDASCHRAANRDFMQQSPATRRTTKGMI